MQRPIEKLPALLAALLLIPIAAAAEGGVLDVSGCVQLMQNVDAGVDLSLASRTTLHGRMAVGINPSESWRIALEGRNLFAYGDTLPEIPFYNELPIAVKYTQPGSFTEYLALDRLSLTWRSDVAEVILGRQRINWAVTRVWNPNDVFGAVSFSDPSYAEKPGTDALRIRWFPDSLSCLECVAAPGSSWPRTGLAALLRFDIASWDFQVLGGKAGYAIGRGSEDDALFAGLGFSGQIGGVGVKGEAAWFASTGAPSASVGLEYYLAAAPLSFRVEGHYCGDPTEPGEITVAPCLSTSALSLFGEMSLTLTPLASVSLDVFWYVDDELLSATLNGFFSLAENLDMRTSITANARLAEVDPFRVSFGAALARHF